MFSTMLALMITLGAGVVEYSTEVYNLMEEVDADSMTWVISRLSGETGVTIDDEPDSIPCRFCFSNGEYKAARWLAEQFEERGFEVELRPFEPPWASQPSVLPLGMDSETWSEIMGQVRAFHVTGEDTMWNVVATLPGKDDQQVLLTAHFDAISDDYWNYTPGADDNASGVAGVLEAARIMADYQWQHTLRFVLFSGEEMGLFGSDEYAYHAKQDGDDILGVLNLDMIAYDGDETPEADIHSHAWDKATQELGELLADVMDVYSLDLVADIHTTDASDRSDHASFWPRMIPAILLIEDFDDFTPFYHTVSDRIMSLDTEYMVQMTKSAVGWTAIMAAENTGPGVAEDDLYSAPGQVKLHLSSPVMNSRSWLTIETPRNITPHVIDASGCKIKCLPTVEAGHHRVHLDFSDLTPGVYWIIAADAASSANDKFVLLK